MRITKWKWIHHLFIVGSKLEDLWAKIGNDEIWELRTVKLLGNETKFDEHLKNLCLIANRKLSSLLRIKKYLNFNKMRILFKAFFKSQFKYCPLTWIFCSRNTNNRINHLQERALRLVYDDYKLTFDKPWEKDGWFTIHHYYIQTLCIELYKVYYNMSQTIFSEFFYTKQ